MQPRPNQQIQQPVYVRVEYNFYLAAYKLGGIFTVGTLHHTAPVICPAGRQPRDYGCYEAIFDASMWWLFEGEEPDPVDLFVVISNDSWFGDTASPHQHAMLTSRHAIQFGRPMVRAATTGVSWVVAPNGRISSSTSAFTELARVATVPLLAVETWYVRGGWAFRWLCVLVALLVSMWGWRREP